MIIQESIVPKCINRYNSYFVCCNENCKQPAFVCKQAGCECQSLHQDCNNNFMKWNKYLKQLQDRQQSNNEQHKNSQLKLDQQMKDLLLQAEIIYTEYKLWMQNLKIHNSEKDVLRLIRQKNYSELTGESLSHLIKQYKYHLFNLSKSIQNEIKSIKLNLEEIFKKIRNCYNVFKRDPFERVEKKLKSNQIFIDSKIIKNAQFLREFFPGHKIEELILIFRASQNQFCVQNFHDKCDNISNTLVLIQTQFNKIIGGYTPFHWDAKKENCWQNDKKKQSFIFSVSQRKKYTLVHPQRAIFNSSCYGPRFGAGSDIFIADKANIYRNSGANFPYSYKSQNQSNNNQSSYNRFSGQTSGMYFKILEWEVFQVKFQ